MAPLDRVALSRVVSSVGAAFPLRAAPLVRELRLAMPDPRTPLPPETCLLCGEEREGWDLARPWRARTPVQEPLCLACVGLAARAADDELAGTRPTREMVTAEIARALAAKGDELVSKVTAILAAPGLPVCFGCGVRDAAPLIVRGARPLCAGCVELYRRDRSCPCCGYATLRERGAFQICPVCFWEDDGQDEEDADDVRGGPNSTLSLTAGRRNFIEIAASDSRDLPHVRRPTAAEPRLRHYGLVDGRVARVPLE